MIFALCAALVLAQPAQSSKPEDVPVAESGNGAEAVEEQVEEAAEAVEEGAEQIDEARRASRGGGGRVAGAR